MKTFASLLCSAVLAGFIHMPAAYGAESVLIDADSMEVIEAEHRTIFKGNVVATRPTDKIVADQMIVTTADQKQSDGSVKTVTNFLDAKGHVTITTATQTIKGDWAKFYIQEDRLEVGGNVSVVQGKSTVRGTKLTINLKSNNLQMSGGRVRGSFVPK